MNVGQEQELWDRCKKQPELVGEFPRDIIADMIAKGKIGHPKEAWATLEKWEAKELYEYGVSLDLGWIVAGARRPPRLEPHVIECGVRETEEDWHIECRFSDGQKMAAVIVDKEFPELAQAIASYLNSRAKRESS